MNVRAINATLNECNELGLGFSSRNPSFSFVRVILRADFDDFRSTVGPRSQLGSCSVMIVVRLLRISSSLG